MQSKHKQTKCEQVDETLTDYRFLGRYHYTKSKNYLKDDIEIVTEFPCLLGHPALKTLLSGKVFLTILTISFLFTCLLTPCTTEDNQDIARKTKIYHLSLKPL